MESSVDGGLEERRGESRGEGGDPERPASGEEAVLSLLSLYLAGYRPWLGKGFSLEEASPPHFGCADPCGFPTGRAPSAVAFALRGGWVRALSSPALAQRPRGYLCQRLFPPS